MTFDHNIATTGSKDEIEYNECANGAVKIKMKQITLWTLKY